MMEWFLNVFSTILNMSLTAVPIILVVLLARLLLKPAPKIFSYMLWLIVLFRLTCPVSLTAEFSLLKIFDDSVQSEYHSDQISSVEYVRVPESTSTETHEDDFASTEESAAVLDRSEYGKTENRGLWYWLPVIWASGVIAILGYSLLALAKLHRQLIGSLHQQDNVYLSDYVDTAFVIGILKPRVYLSSTDDISEDERQYILLHEQHHIQRGDHLWKLLAFFVLTMHWFNPLVWLSYSMMIRDMEMSCDEAVIRNFESDQNILVNYAQLLLRLASGHKSIMAPLAFDKGDIRSRIKNIMKWKRPKNGAKLLATLGTICIMAACSVNPPTHPADPTHNNSNDALILGETHISKTLSSGVIIDADVEIAPSIDLNQLSEFDAELVQLDYDLLKQILFSEQQITEEGYEVRPDIRTDSQYHYCIADDESFLSYMGEGFNYQRGKQKLIQSILNSKEINLSQYINSETLSFATKETAQKDIQSILEQLDIEVNDNPICYTFSFDSLEYLCNQINTDRKNAAGEDLFLYTPLTCDKSDACYAFLYQIMAEGLPVSSQPSGILDDGSLMPGTSLCCIYSEQGIIRMELPYTFKSTGQNMQKNKGLRVNQVLEQFEHQLGSTSMNGEYRVNNIKFEYVPIQSAGSRTMFQLVPAWRLSVIHTYQYQDEKDHRETVTANEEFDVIFHAVSGEEIIIDVGNA